MATVVGVVFSPGGRVYSFDPGGLELPWNTRVICQTARGKEYGRVVQPNHEVPERSLKGPLKRIVRAASDDDTTRVEQNREEAKRAMTVFRELREQHAVDIAPVSAEIVFDGSRIVFSYRSDERPDVAALERDLGRRLERRIELRSVGPREAARLCGGHGLCGGQMCCTRYPSHEEPITLRMAKDQDMPMASGRMTGLCGRLRCCLAFEHPVYRSFRDRAPRVGSRVETPLGVGRVRAYEVLKDACVVLLESDDQKGSRGVEVPIDDCSELPGGGEPTRPPRRPRTPPDSADRPGSGR